MLMLYSAILFNHKQNIPKGRIVWLNFLKTIAKQTRSQYSKICANLIDFIGKIISSQEFLEQSRQNSADFSRNRKLPFVFIVLYFLNFLKSSYQPELNKFFKILSGSAVAKKFISKAAYCKARKKLKYEAFTFLNNQAVNHFQENFNPRTWHGFFLKAVDGSTVKLPKFLEIENHFGSWNPRQGDSVPMARVSQMFDPLNRITCHALIGPKSTGERDMAANHFEQLKDQDLVLLDRGYPAFWLFKLILSQHAHFCSRISTKKWKIIRKFIQSGKMEQLVTIEVPPTSVAACAERGLDTLPMRLRLIRVELDSCSEPEVLITSLTDSNKYPHALFAELYHDRWPVEEDYKVIKCRIEIENFTGQSELSVYQDFHARIFSKNITSMLTFAAQERVEQTDGGKKYHYKINFTQALSAMRDSIVLLFQRTGRPLKAIIVELLKTLTTAIEPVRPERQYERKHKRSQRKYCLNYKPIL